jgi:hypothetical protein
VPCSAAKLIILISDLHSLTGQNVPVNTQPPPNMTAPINTAIPVVSLGFQETAHGLYVDLQWVSAAHCLNINSFNRFPSRLNLLCLQLHCLLLGLAAHVQWWEFFLATLFSFNFLTMCPHLVQKNKIHLTQKFNDLLTAQSAGSTTLTPNITFDTPGGKYYWS